MPLKFFINLERDQVRANAMQKAFASCNHQPIRFNAVDWRALSKAEQLHYYSPNLNEKKYFRSLTDGECGCYASHIAIWNVLVLSNAPWALVLEDDVEPIAGFDSVISAIDDLPMNWDMIKLIGRDNEKIARKHELLVGYQLIQYSRIPSLTGAYLISRLGAQKLLASRLPFGRPIDVDLRSWWENDLSVFGVWPYPVKLASTSFDSSIGERAKSRQINIRLRKAKILISYHLNVLMSSKKLAVHWSQLFK